VLPTSIERIELFGPHPSPGTLVDCTLKVGRLDDRTLRGDLQLAVEGRLWCRITNWEDRRFATDGLVFETLQWPERAGMSVERAGYTLIDERWPDAPSRDVVMRRYLGRDERQTYEQHHPLGQRQFLLGRIAVKDAVRRWLWAHGRGPLFPAEIAVADDARGQPLVRGPFAADLRVGLAHVEGLAVARVAEGADVGVDVQRVDTRRPGFEEVVLTPHEQQLSPPAGYDRDTWLTCLWAVKEAAARAGGGAGLDGRPKELEIVERQGTVARIGGVRIAFERLPQARRRDATRKEHVIAWTLTDR
jgi:phosphopantetheinyl transferase (holo-ACP synthase)